MEGAALCGQAFQRARAGQRPRARRRGRGQGELPRFQRARGLLIHRLRCSGDGARQPAVLRFQSSAYQHAFTFDLEGHRYVADDNGFDLYPNEAKDVVVELSEKAGKSDLIRALKYRSLVDSYA